MNKGNMLQRDRAVKAYYENPIFCKYCNNIIHVKDGVKVPQVKKKVFCDHSCAAKYNNIGVVRNKPRGACLDCGVVVKSEVKRCGDCYSRYIKDKRERKKKRKKSDVHRMTITKDARRVLDNAIDIDKRCFVCGYDIHVEACHIKPVSDFDDSCSIGEINSLSNLVWLCPNHHWEFDNIYDEKSRRDIGYVTQAHNL